MNATPQLLTANERLQIFREAIIKLGPESRYKKVQEECIELAGALIHYRDGRATIEEVAGELVDVQNTAWQLAEILKVKHPGVYEMALEEKTRKMQAAIQPVDEELVDRLANCNFEYAGAITGVDK